MNGATGGSYSYCPPALSSVYGRQFEPLAGWGGGFGTQSCTSAAAVARGALLQIECLRKTQGTQTVQYGVGEGYARGVWVSSAAPGRARGDKAVAFHNPQAFSNVQEEESRSCARDQVVVARPPVLTPPWRYRRSLVSKGRFATSINVICVGIRSSLSKRRYHVVIDYVGDLLRHRRGRAWCWLFRGL
jgi:hypothetical protein